MLASGFDVFCLRAFVSATEEDDQDGSYLAEVHAVARTVVDFQFHHTFTHGLMLAKIAKLDTR